MASQKQQSTLLNILGLLDSYDEGSYHDSDHLAWEDVEVDPLEDM